MKYSRFVAIFILMVIMRWPATKAMPVSWIIAAMLAYWVWEKPPNWIAAASINGAFENMICVHNIIAACATAGLVADEGIPT